jgi:hypothetical protein
MCSMILLMPIPIVLFLGFLTWGSHSHFIEIRSTTWGPIGRNVVHFVHLRVLHPIVATHPICVFLSLANDTHSRSCIKCGSCVFTIAGRVISIRFFSAANEVCNLVSSGVGPLYTFPFGFFIPNSTFHILGAPVGSTSFFELFVVKVLHENLRTISSLPMLVNP